jgi:hypothetical protein
VLLDTPAAMEPLPSVHPAVRLRKPIGQEQYVRRFHVERSPELAHTFDHLAGELDECHAATGRGIEHYAG